MIKTHIKLSELSYPEETEIVEFGSKTQIIDALKKNCSGYLSSNDIAQIVEFVTTDIVKTKWFSKEEWSKNKKNPDLVPPKTKPKKNNATKRKKIKDDDEFKPGNEKK